MKQTLKTIASLLKGFNYSIGGSISLSANGIIHRQPNDIDIVLDRAALARLSWSGEFSEVPTYTDHDWHVRFLHNDHFVCCFVSDDIKLQPKKDIVFMGVLLPIQHPYCTIQVKEAVLREIYANPPITPDRKAQRDKHIADIEAWERYTSRSSQF